VNGWSLGYLKLNEKNKALVQVWIIAIDIRDKKKEVGI
jgi:hypothetical protein